MENKEYLNAAAQAVAQQSAELPDIEIPVDPEVAEYMGAFKEDALTPEDVDLATNTPEVAGE